ncbi:hypothetical protein D3C85_1668310 [compost metagenome]
MRGRKRHSKARRFEGINLGTDPTIETTRGGIGRGSRNECAGTSGHGQITVYGELALFGTEGGTDCER